jgi:hypothetical protein
MSTVPKREPCRRGHACGAHASAIAEGAPCYSHRPESVHLWFLRQQLHSRRPQHALGCRVPLLQHAVHLPRRLLQ